MSAFVVYCLRRECNTMHYLSSLVPSRTALKLTVLLLVLATLFANVRSTYADPRDPGGAKPHTPVSSDGFVPEASKDRGPKGPGETESLPAEGTGEQERGDATTATEERVLPAVAPGQEATPESVIGTDGRYRITSTTSYPYRAIAHITSSIGGCTGWLINANTVVTAGHCVYGSSGWASNVRVYPGRDGSSTPYGSCGALRLHSVTGWTVNRDRNYDYGAIKLNCSVGNTTGWFGYRWQSSSLTGQASYIAGYPGDKTYGTMWRHDDQVRITQTYRLYYANDTAGGQSGSPVWNGTSTCSPCGVGIHAYGVDGTGYNGGTRITESVFNNLTTWKNS